MKTTNWLARFVAGTFLLGGSAVSIAADLANGTPTAIKDSECNTDVSQLFYSDSVPPLIVQHPTLPVGHFYELVRYVGNDSISRPVETDFGHFAQDYPYPPLRGQPLTGFTPPLAHASYQRANSDSATPDTSSAFQLSCYDSGSYINTWTFPYLATTAGSAHSIFGYSFENGSLPKIYDGQPGTDLVLQAQIEVPWFYGVPDPNAQNGDVPVGQVSIFAYFKDQTSNHVFAMLLGVYDNRFTTPGSKYGNLVSHDGSTPFVSTPIAAGSQFATLSPYSATFSGNTWSGLRFFRMNITPDNFRQAIASVNAYCSSNPTQGSCNTSSGVPAFSTSVTDYVMTDFGVLHEVFRQGTNGNLSMGIHVYGLGVFNFR